GGDALLNRGVNGAVVDERAAGGIDELEAVEVPGAELGDLAGGTSHWILVALPTGLRVVDRAETFLDRVDLLEGTARGIEVRLLRKAIGQVVVAGRGLGDVYGRKPCFLAHDAGRRRERFGLRGDIVGCARSPIGARANEERDWQTQRNRYQSSMLIHFRASVQGRSTSRAVRPAHTSHTSAPSTKSSRG